MPVSPPSATSGPGWLRRLSGYCLRHRRDLFLAFGAAIAGAIVSAAVPLVIRHVIDQATGPHSGTASVTGWVAALVIAAFLQYAITFIRRYSAGRLSLDVQYDMRADLFGSLARLDGRGQDELDTGQVVSRAITDLGLVQGLLAFIPLLASNALLFVVSIIVMLVLSPLLTLIALAIAPALWLLARASRRDLFPANWDAQQLSGEVVGQVEAAVTGVRVVKGFGQENRELTELEGRAKRLFASRMRVVRLQSRYSPALQAIPALGQVGVLLLGGWLALHGHLTLGTFLAFSTYLGQLVGPVRQLSALLTVGQQARAGVERVLDIVDTGPTVLDQPGALDLPAGPLRVEFEHVRFAYHSDAPVLTDLSLTIEPGETVAVVGGSGSGKSTLAMLLPRFYDVQAGGIRLGGLDLRELKQSSIHQRVGVVFEDSFLFSSSVRDNISYGRPDATDAQVEAAARAARADGFIDELPEGYDTVIGERGMTLSGGQRQRVSLARAILFDPDVLVLDDATSAIDPQIESEINNELRALTRTRSTLLIAHRRSSLELADRVAVLDGGRIVDIGTVADLEARSELFGALMAASPLELPDVDPLDREIDAELDPPPMSVTSAAWPAVRTAEGGPGAAAALRASAAGGGGWAASLAATPELLAQVAALPPPTDTPDISSASARAGDPEFGLRRLIRPLRAILFLGLFLVGLDTVAQLVVPSIIRAGIDDGVSRHAEHVLVILSIVALAVLLVDWVISRLGLLVTGRTGERLLYTLRVKTFAHLQRLGLDYYERELGGRIMTRMTTDIDALSNFLQTGLSTTLISLLTLVGVLIALIILNTGLSLVLICMLPLLLAATWLFRAKSVPAYTEARERVGAVNAALQENVAGIRVTQSMNRERRNTDEFLAAGRSYQQSRLRAQRYISVYFPFVQLLSDLAAAIVLGIGSQWLRHGTLSAGVLIAFFLYLDAFFSPVQQLSQVFDGYQQSSVGLRRLRDLLRTPTSTPPAPDPQPVGRLSGAISLRAVHFAYTGAVTEAVSDLNLEIAPGETVALVGETGAGKSTVVKLIARFYDPTAGQVLVDGRDVRQLDLGAFRGRLGVVPQEAHLSQGTVRDAIAYGRPAASDAEVEAAARAVGAHDMIADLTDGYFHDVGERGCNLSAGQRQLVALARAQLVDPDILLLDEATASLDLASEAAVTRATRALARRRTTVVVAHRLTTAAAADRIVVMAHGRIVEIGSHDELLALDGTYAALWDTYSGHLPIAS